MQYNALVEQWPSEYMVYFRELPGCLSTAPMLEEALAAAPAAIANHVRWLKANDLIEEIDNAVTVVVKEQLAAGDNDKGPRFEAELAPPGDEEIDMALNVAGMARAELIDLYESMPAEQRVRALAPGAWSVDKHLWHIIEAELWYVSRLSDVPREKPLTELSPEISVALFDVGMDSELALRGLSEEQRSRVFTHEGEEWTAAKVLRRLAGHLREHYPWLKKMAV
ncbi:MAG TPA: DinB family protein [Ktedonobacteraceae bacterium]|nr:DinB family protein [Ktedonobacteraceae bacterium]